MVDVTDYLLGRNALDRSFVSGFDMRSMHRPCHRFRAKAADPRYPAPPSGVVSGGPNSTAMTDDLRAFTMNEVAINRNALLVWVAAFLD